MKKFILFIFGAFFSVLGFSQDPFFTNTNQSLVYLNPSFSGSNGFIRNQFMYRNQWPSISGPTYVTFSNAFDAYIKPMSGGVSLSALLDDQGDGTLKTNWFSFAYAQYLSAFHKILKIIPAVQATYITETLDKTKLNFGSSVNSRYNSIWNNPSSVPTVSQKSYDFNSGLLFQVKNFYFGVAIFHLLQPDIGLFGESKLPTKTNVHASYNFSIKQKTKINLSFLTSFQANFALSVFNATLVYRKLIFGLGYTSGDDFIANAGIHFKSFNLCYTFDQTTSKLSGNLAASHQLSFSLNLRKKAVRDTLANMENW